MGKGFVDSSSELPADSLLGGIDMQTQTEFINDTGSSVIMTVTERGKYSTLTVEHEDYDGQGGPVHEQDVPADEIDKVCREWVRDLLGLKFRPV
jgi:hypothetical protein